MQEPVTATRRFSREPEPARPRVCTARVRKRQWQLLWIQEGWLEHHRDGDHQRGDRQATLSLHATRRPPTDQDTATAKGHRDCVKGKSCTETQQHGVFRMRLCRHAETFRNQFSCHVTQKPLYCAPHGFMKILHSST